MGRPLNQKYFGNYNKGSTSTNSDNGMGGEGVSSVTINTAGSYLHSLPTAAFSIPELPGVRATGSVVGRAVSAAMVSSGAGYGYHDVLTAVGGTGTAATFQVNSLITVGTPSLTAGGVNYDISGGAKDEIWFDSSVDSRWTVPLKIRVDTVTGGHGVATFTVLQQGVWTGSNPPSTVIGASTHNGPIDNNGSGATFTLTWGVNSVGVVAGGSYTAVTNGASSTTGGTGTGATLNVSYGVSGMTVTEKGSGYLSVADAAITFSPAGAAATPVLTTSQTNAIIVYAMVDSSVKAADAVKQISTNRYRVETYEGTGVCKLVSHTPAAAGEMSINATDSDGGTYWVMKITSNHALLIQNTGTQFDNHTLVKWTFGNPEAGTSVKIDNF